LTYSEINKEELELLKKSPESYLKALSELEYDIVRVLFFSPHGLTERQVQKFILINILLNHYREDAPFTKDESTGETRVIYGLEHFGNDLKELYPDGYGELDLFFEKTADAKKELLEFSNEELLRISKKAGLPTPSHKTVGRVLEILVSAGFVNLRKGQDKRANGLYFINQLLYALLKQSGVMEK